MRTVVVALALAAMVAPVRAETSSDDWFRLIIALQQRENQLDADDRKFIRYMVNVMTVEENVIPKPEHQRWLLDIKRRHRVK